MHNLQLLPIGQQDFGELRRANRLYVDKTNYIYNMLHHGGVFFSCPSAPIWQVAVGEHAQMHF